MIQRLHVHYIILNIDYTMLMMVSVSPVVLCPNSIVNTKNGLGSLG